MNFCCLILGNYKNILTKFVIFFLNVIHRYLYILIVTSKFVDIRLTDIRTDMKRVRISYLFNRTDTYIILSTSMDIHLHL